VTVFLGGGFAAKYLHGGGNFSVPLQWMLGLRRLKLDAFWLEHSPSEGNTRDDERKIADDNCTRTDSAAGIVALSQNTGQRARSRRNSLHWNVETRIARSTRRPDYSRHNAYSAASSFLKEGGGEEKAPQYVSGRLVIGYLCLENVSTISYCNRRLYQI
jgi:hypothetical protein